MLGFACQIVRGLSAFAPCLEHVCAGGGGGSVENAGLLIHDGVGKYVLPSNHSVLVLSDRCQFGCHGEARVFVCGLDCSRHHMFRWGPLIGLRSVAHLKTRQMGSPRV